MEPTCSSLPTLQHVNLKQGRTLKLVEELEYKYIVMIKSPPYIDGKTFFFLFPTLVFVPVLSTSKSKTKYKFRNSSYYFHSEDVIRIVAAELPRLLLHFVCLCLCATS